MPTLELHPEPFADLFRRVPAALAKTWDADVIGAADKDFADRPGKHRENVFDGRDDDFGQYRVILSRETVKDGTETVLHGSVSFVARRASNFAHKRFGQSLVESLLNLPGDAEPLHLFQTAGGVFHFVYPDKGDR